MKTCAGVAAALVFGGCSGSSADIAKAQSAPRAPAINLYDQNSAAQKRRQIRHMNVRFELDPTFPASLLGLSEAGVLNRLLTPLEKSLQARGSELGPVVTSPSECHAPDCPIDLTMRVALRAPSQGLYRLEVTSVGLGQHLAVSLERGRDDLNVLLHERVHQTPDGLVQISIINDLDLIGRSVCESITKEACQRGYER